MGYNRPMREKPKGKSVARKTREELARMLQSTDPKMLAEALRSAAYYDPDWRWVQTVCLQYLAHADAGVRRSAATCLGLVAVFHKRMDVPMVVLALENAAKDPEVRDCAEESLEDIRHTFGLER